MRIGIIIAHEDGGEKAVVLAGPDKMSVIEAQWKEAVASVAPRTIVRLVDPDRGTVKRSRKVGGQVDAFVESTSTNNGDPADLAGKVSAPGSPQISSPPRYHDYGPERGYYGGADEFAPLSPASSEPPKPSARTARKLTGIG